MKVLAAATLDSQLIKVTSVVIDHKGKPETIVTEVKQLEIMLKGR